MGKKKTNSTDNIIEFVTTNSISDPRTIEAMVREVDLALRYFQDAVSKSTYEMLPGKPICKSTECQLHVGTSIF